MNVVNEIYVFLPGLLVIYTIFLLQNASPGPNVLAVIGTSMAVSRTSGMAQGIGVAAGTLTWSTFSVVGLSAVIAAYGSALFAVKIAGGTYLLWLAYKSFRSALSNVDLDATVLGTKEQSAARYFQRGYIINMTNPKAAIGWIAIVSLGLEPNAPIWVGIAIITGTTMISLAVHTIYALLFSTPPMVRVYQKARRPIQGILGLFFVFAGHRLLTTEVQ